MHQIATPVSHLSSLNGFFEKISAFGSFEARERKVPIHYRDKVTLYHSEIELTQNWSTKQKQKLTETIRYYRKLRAISLHMVTNNTAYVIKNGVAHGCGRILSRMELLKNAQDNTRWLKLTFPDLEVMVENNNDLGNPCYKNVTDPDFITEVVVSNEIHFLYDHSHAMISAHNQHSDFSSYFRKLPLQKARQVHFSAHDVIKGRWVDAHNLPNKEQFQFCLEELGGLPLFLTIEYYKDIVNLVQALSSLQSVVKDSLHAR